MITKFVDFDTFMDQYGLFLKAAYEKCNIHAPFDSLEVFYNVLLKEWSEANDALHHTEFAINTLSDDIANGQDEAVLAADITEIEAEALKTIMELLQVMAVCQKWRGDH